MKVMRKLSVLFPVLAGVTLLGVPQVVQGEPLGIPCAGRAKAVIANTGQSVHNSATLVDSYRSSLGPYGGANVGVHGDVQAGGLVVVHPGGVINGAVLSGTPAGLVVVPIPAGATNLGNFNVNGPVTLGAGSYRANTLNINSGGTLSVTGRVRIWVTGAVNINALANPGGIPDNLEILLTGAGPVAINSGGQLFGLLYAPLAQVWVNSSVFGSVVGSAVTLNSGGRVHFDQDSACPVCPAGQVVCGIDICTSTQSDPNNCGACGVQCPLTNACEMGTCIAGGSCLPGNAPSAISSTSNVFVYEPLASWIESTTGVKRFQIEPVGSPPAVTVPTVAPINSCAGNATTKVVTCTGNANDVYIINPSAGVPGTVVSTTLSDGATGTQFFSGGFPSTAGLAVDPVNNRAFLAVGLAPGGVGGFQPLNLATLAFSPVIPALGLQTSEDILVDPLRNFVLSPNEQNDYLLLNTATSTVFNMPIPTGGEMDSAAEDCSTGIALASVEFTGELVLVNLNGATFGAGTWTAPFAVPNFPEFTALAAGTSGISVDPRSHLGVVTGEFGGAAFGAIQLPSAPLAASATPAVLDYVAATVPNDPNNVPWQMGFDPHSTTVYSSPTSGRSFAVIMNQPRSFVAVVDLQALLAAPRVAGTHNAQSPLPAGVIRFVQ